MTSGPLPAGAATLNYDKENRLRSAVCNGVTSLYIYDALGRLLSVDQPNSSGAPTKEICTWSSWTMLARAIYTSGSLTETFRYTWGLDLSGSLGGAGGVGGLLAIERNVAGTTTWDIRYAHNDANGNNIALTDSTGNVSARYRYDAFGNTLSATDVDNTGWVNHNIHRFSTKPTFGNTGLLFYGYRWYTPRDARWLNRDPIGERGGMNLYGFCYNDGVDKWDLLGLQLPSGGPASSMNPLALAQYYSTLVAEYGISKALQRKLLEEGIKLTVRQIVKHIEDSGDAAAIKILLDKSVADALEKTTSEGVTNTGKEWCARTSINPQERLLGTFCYYVCPSGAEGRFVMPTATACPMRCLPLIRRDFLEDVQIPGE